MACLGVSAIGAVVGAAIGTGMLAGLLSDGFRELILVDVQLGLLFGGTVGGVLGALLAPLLGLIVLRPVSLGRALVWCAGCTVAGSYIAAVLAPSAILAPTWGGVAGLVAGALVARLTTRAR